MLSANQPDCSTMITYRRQRLRCIRVHGPPVPFALFDAVEFIDLDRLNGAEGQNGLTQLALQVLPRRPRYFGLAGVVFGDGQDRL